VPKGWSVDSHIKEGIGIRDGPEQGSQPIGEKRVANAEPPGNRERQDEKGEQRAFLHAHSFQAES
jgi:hypothetical protein